MKTTYTQSDLNQFEEIIREKLTASQALLRLLQEVLGKQSENGDDDTNWHNRGIEDATTSVSKEEAFVLINKQKRFIDALNAALKRIENKTYGMCVVSGEQIP